MTKKDINFSDRILVAGAKGMVGSAICRSLRQKGYGNKKLGGEILSPSKNELNYLNYDETFRWFEANNPSIVIIAAAKVGGIIANKTMPTELEKSLIENFQSIENFKEQFVAAGVSQFGSGWCWLVKNKDDSLEITKT